MRSRRALLAAVAAAGLGPILGRAQQPGKVRSIGFLANASPFEPKYNEWYWRPLHNRGWRERENIVIERRWASEQNELLKPMAEELVKLRVELIVGHGTRAALAAKSVTGTTPIVVHRSGDPVASGLVASLSRPGGNVTGTSTITVQLDVKRLELVREMLPHAKRIGEMIHSPNPVHLAARKYKEDLYRSFGLTPIFVDAKEASEIERAIDEVVGRGGQALIFPTETLFGQNLSTIVTAARRSSLPLVAGESSALGTGVLVSYGPSELEFVENLAGLVDQILRGRSQATCPFASPPSSR